LYRSKNTFEIAKNLIVPKSKHPKSIGGQATISYRVCYGLAVLSAVHLNDEQPFAANEIANVIANRLLSYKFMPVDLSATNAIPENCFRVRLIDAQPSRYSGHLPIWPTHWLAPHPEAPLRAASDLSPQRRGRG
jgi:hypothetical protein